MLANKTKKIFIVSIILNVFLLSYIISSHFINSVQQNLNPIMRFEQAIETLPMPYKKDIKNKWDLHRKDLRAHIGTMFSSMQNVRAILTAEKLDLDAFQQVHLKMLNSDKDLKKKMSNMAIEIASVLPDEERIKFFKAAIPSEMPLIMKLHIKNN